MVVRSVIVVHPLMSYIQHSEVKRSHTVRSEGLIYLKTSVCDSCLTNSAHRTGKKQAACANVYTVTEGDELAEVPFFMLTRNYEKQEEKNIHVEMY